MIPEVSVMLALAESSMLPMRMHFRAKMDTRRPMAPRTMPTIIRARTACSMAGGKTQQTNQTSSAQLLRLWFNKPQLTCTKHLRDCKVHKLWTLPLSKDVELWEIQNTSLRILWLMKDMYSDVYRIRELWMVGTGEALGLYLFQLPHFYSLIIWDPERENSLSKVRVRITDRAYSCDF